MEIPEAIQTEQQAEIPEKTPVVTQAEMVDKTPVATQAEIPEKTLVATQAEIPEKTTVVIQVEIVVIQVEIPEKTPVATQVELTAVTTPEVQPSRFFFAAYAPVTIGNKTIDALIYSVTYNGSYLAVEGIITIIVISIPPVKKALDYVKQMANSR